MKNKHLSENKIQAGGVTLALVSSLCCITPVFSLIAGISGIAATFSWLEPVRPYLMALTVLFLGFAWYQKLKPQDITCNCDVNEKSKFTHLAIVTVLAFLLMAFPAYSGVFFFSSAKETIMVDSKDVKTYQFTISGMSCDGCEETVNHEVSKLSGIINVKSSYNNGNAVVKFDSSRINDTAIQKMINTTGYKVTDKKELK